MKALINIFNDLRFQCRIRGGRPIRLFFISTYYLLYILGRLRGLSRSPSRELALEVFAKWKVYRYTVRINWPQGLWMRLYVYDSCFLPKELEEDHMYDHFIQFRPGPGQVVVDVGCQQGTYALLAASWVGPHGKVIGIEAMPDNFLLFKENVSNNKLSQIVPVEIAASNCAGEARFHSFRYGVGGSLVMALPGSEEIRVSTDTVDHILEGLGITHIDLIKIDVEGACLKVLQGAERTLRQKPRLVMEVEGRQSDIEGVCRHVQQRGYKTQTFHSIVYAEAA